MKKFQATIQFDMNDEFMSLIPAHRVYVNSLIEKGAIDQYAVSMESQQVWITFYRRKQGRNRGLSPPISAPSILDLRN